MQLEEKMQVLQSNFDRGRHGKRCDQWTKSPEVKDTLAGEESRDEIIVRHRIICEIDRAKKTT